MLLISVVYAEYEIDIDAGLNTDCSVQCTIFDPDYPCSDCPDVNVIHYTGSNSYYINEYSEYNYTFNDPANSYGFLYKKTMDTDGNWDAQWEHNDGSDGVPETADDVWVDIGSNGRDAPWLEHTDFLGVGCTNDYPPHSCEHPWFPAWDSGDNPITPGNDPMTEDRRTMFYVVFKDADNNYLGQTYNYVETWDITAPVVQINSTNYGPNGFSGTSSDVTNNGHGFVDAANYPTFGSVAYVDVTNDSQYFHVRNDIYDEFCTGDGNQHCASYEELDICSGEGSATCSQFNWTKDAPDESAHICGHIYEWRIYQDDYIGWSNGPDYIRLRDNPDDPRIHYDEDMYTFAYNCPEASAAPAADSCSASKNTYKSIHINFNDAAFPDGTEFSLIRKGAGGYDDITLIDHAQKGDSDLDGINDDGINPHGGPDSGLAPDTYYTYDFVVHYPNYQDPDDGFDDYVHTEGCSTNTLEPIENWACLSRDDPEYPPKRIVQTWDQEAQYFYIEDDNNTSHNWSGLYTDEEYYGTTPPAEDVFRFKDPYIYTPGNVKYNIKTVHNSNILWGNGEVETDTYNSDVISEECSPPPCDPDGTTYDFNASPDSASCRNTDQPVDLYLYDNCNDPITGVNFEFRFTHSGAPTYPEEENTWATAQNGNQHVLDSDPSSDFDEGSHELQMRKVGGGSEYSTSSYNIDLTLPVINNMSVTNAVVNVDVASDNSQTLTVNVKDDLSNGIHCGLDKYYVNGHHNPAATNPTGSLYEISAVNGSDNPRRGTNQNCGSSPFDIYGDMKQGTSVPTCNQSGGENNTTLTYNIDFAADSSFVTHDVYNFVKLYDNANNDLPPAVSNNYIVNHSPVVTLSNPPDSNPEYNVGEEIPFDAVVTDPEADSIVWSEWDVTCTDASKTKPAPTEINDLVTITSDMAGNQCSVKLCVQDIYLQTDTSGPFESCSSVRSFVINAGPEVKSMSYSPSADITHFGAGIDEAGNGNEFTSSYHFSVQYHDEDGNDNLNKFRFTINEPHRAGNNPDDPNSMVLLMQKDPGATPTPADSDGYLNFYNQDSSNSGWEQQCHLLSNACDFSPYYDNTSTGPPPLDSPDGSWKLIKATYQEYDVAGYENDYVQLDFWIYFNPENWNEIVDAHAFTKDYNNSDSSWILYEVMYSENLFPDIDTLSPQYNDFHIADPTSTQDPVCHYIDDQNKRGYSKNGCWVDYVAELTDAGLNNNIGSYSFYVVNKADSSETYEYTYNTLTSSGTLITTASDLDFGGPNVIQVGGNLEVVQPVVATTTNIGESFNIFFSGKDGTGNGSTHPGNSML